MRDFGDRAIAGNRKSSNVWLIGYVYLVNGSQRRDSSFLVSESKQP